MIDTKERILETAERSFAENGYAATSLRSIINEAGVNLAAVHYHFGSKEELLKAVILRRAEPVNAKRLAMLDACENAGLEKILEAFITPTFEVAMQPGGLQFVRLMGRMYAETDMLPQIIKSEFRPLLMRFHDALRRALPDLAPDELLRRLFFGAGALAHTLRAYGTPGFMFLHTDIGAVQASLIQFICAGLRGEK
jgi:AcrR family transcriptional regulator